jgi:hypothetical protein
VLGTPTKIRIGFSVRVQGLTAADGSGRHQKCKITEPSVFDVIQVIRAAYIHTRPTPATRRSIVTFIELLWALDSMKMCATLHVQIDTACALSPLSVTPHLFRTPPPHTHTHRIPKSWQLAQVCIDSRQGPKTVRLLTQMSESIVLEPSSTDHEFRYRQHSENYTGNELNAPVAPRPASLQYGPVGVFLDDGSHRLRQLPVPIQTVEHRHNRVEVNHLAL